MSRLSKLGSGLDNNNNKKPSTRDTIGEQQQNEDGEQNNNNDNSNLLEDAEFHVVPKRVVDACAELRVSLTRRLDVQHVIDRFDEARNRTILSNSNPNFIVSTDSQNQNNNNSNSRNTSHYTATRFNRISDTNFGNNTSNNNREIAGGGAPNRSIAKKLARLQQARNILIANASPSVTKEIFAQVPTEWLKVARSAIVLFIYFVAFLVVPCSALQMDCSIITCNFNNASLKVNSTARERYLHSVQKAGTTCPFELWSNALFGIWFLVGAAVAFGVLVFVWTVADTFFAPFHAKFKSLTTRTVVATISSIPFKTRLFVVVPPLLGFGITGTMIYFRMKAEAENITWSWGTIAAPAIVGYGLALLLKLWISWKYLGARGDGDSVRNVLPANWAKLLLIIEAFAMTVAALVGPSVASKMADCNDYGPYWGVVILPFVGYFGVKILTTLVELMYRAANGNTSGNRNGLYDLDTTTTTTTSSLNDANDDEDDEGEKENPGDSQAINFENDSRPAWQDFVRLIYRECSICAGLIMVLMKLKYGYTIGWIDWIFITIPFLVTAGIGFFIGIVELRAAIRYASEQFCSLEEMLGQQQQQQQRNRGGKKANSLEESLSPYGAVDDEV